MFDSLITKLAASLKRANIPYMIIGGQAVLLYGEPRMTKDIDITIGVGIDKLNVINNLAHKLKLFCLADDAEKFVKKTMVLPFLDNSSKIRVDIIFSYTDYEREAIKRAKKVTINKTVVRFASLEDLIILKLFAGRARDIEDLKSILRKKPKLDKKYIKKWLKLFDKSTRENLSKKFIKLIRENY